jgi:uncharacterized protein involved in exopolysaccharide biosynthesis
VAGVDPHVDALDRQRRRILARLAAAEGGPPVAEEAPMDPAMAAALEAARRDLERASADLASAQARYTDAHPDVVAAKRRLDAAKAALEAAEQAAQVSSPLGPIAGPPTAADKQKLEQQLAVLEDNLSKARKQKTEGDVDEGAKKSGNWIVDLETQWASLNRDVAEVRERYQQIQRRFFQASIIAKVEASGGAAQMVVIDAAYKPERPERRGSRRVGAAGAAVALFFGALLALALAYLDDRVYDDRDLALLDLGGLAHTVPPGGRHG